MSNFAAVYLSSPARVLIQRIILTLPILSLKIQFDVPEVDLV